MKQESYASGKAGGMKPMNRSKRIAWDCAVIFCGIKQRHQSLDRKNPAIAYFDTQPYRQVAA
jgi:hypothetical protein